MTDHEATVSEMKSGPDSVRWIAPMAGVESIAEFKQMMDSIFAEDERARFYYRRIFNSKPAESLLRDS